MGTAAWAAPVSPVHRSALLGQSLTWRPAGAGLPANFNACAARQAGCRARAAASRRVLTSTFLQQEKNSI